MLERGIRAQCVCLWVSLNVNESGYLTDLQGSCLVCGKSATQTLEFDVENRLRIQQIWGWQQGSGEAAYHVHDVSTIVSSLFVRCSRIDGDAG